MVDHIARTLESGIDKSIDNGDILLVGAGINPNVAGAFSVGSTSTSLSLGKAGALATFLGNVRIEGTALIIQDSEFQDEAVIDGGLELTTAGLVMTGLDIGETGKEIGDIYTDGFIRMRVSTTPTNVADHGFPYVADASGKAELFYLDEDNNDVQITSGGFLATAISGLSNNYTFAYDTTMQAITGANFQDVDFSNNAQIDGWNHTGGTAVFTCNKTALYEATVDICINKTAGGNVTFAMRSLFNGVEVAGSQKGIDIPMSNATIGMSKSFQFSGVTGQVFKVQIASSSTDANLIPGKDPGSATTVPSASLTIKRIT